jgi:iron complex transport system permease protein
MQGVFRNPLVDPGLLGVANGAALAACASIVLGKHAVHYVPAVFLPYFLPIAAFAGALAATLAVDRLARSDGRTAVATLLLAGIGSNALMASLTGFLIAAANDAELRTITFWTLGSLSGARWQTVLLVLPCVAVGIVLLPRAARPLDALLLGEAAAEHVGFEVERVKRSILVLVALAVGACVAVAGVLGFVGLVVPHLLRLWCGPGHRVILAGSALLGASLLLLADALARTLVAPAELPLGVVTGALGTPFFLALLVREKRRLP